MTSVRSVQCRIKDGCRILSDQTLDYSDGAEQRVFEILKDANDLSSTSDELATQATSWAERYHLSTARSNLLRPFALPEHTVALEIGAGCGAVTRLLGERCATVDALEPVFARARAARLRTRDQEGVEVFVGSVTDLPVEPVYDLVVVVGVLEYVGNGSMDLVPQREFLQSIAAVLKSGGSLVLAIENRLGVKYLAGAGEDHTGRVYDSIEGYPQGTVARTFSRTELQALLSGAGLSPTFYQAFSDYKLTRVVMSDTLIDQEPALAWRLPQFPSEDRVGTSSRAINEERLWRALVSDGVGGRFGNSFVVTASKQAPTHDLWPPEQLAAFYQPDRRALFATETRVSCADGNVIFRRQHLRPSSGETGTQSDASAVDEHVLVRGTDQLELLETADDAELAHQLQRWIDVVDREAGRSGTYPPDLLPHNLVEREDGELQVIDQEWQDSDYSRADLLGRCALITGWKLASRTPPSRWPVATFGELVVHLGTLIGLDPAGTWVEAAVKREAEFQARVLVETQWDMDGPDQLASIRSGLQQSLAMPLTELPLGTRDHQRLAEQERWLQQALGANAQAIDAVDGVTTERNNTVNALTSERDALATELDQMRSSSSWRLTEPVRSLTRLARRYQR